jgi:hypothetical protein
MASKNTEMKNEQMKKRTDAFLEDWKNTMTELNARHEFKADDGSFMSFEMLPKLQANDFSIQAVYGIGYTRREKIKVGEKPKVDGQPDSDDKVS